MLYCLWFCAETFWSNIIHLKKCKKESYHFMFLLTEEHSKVLFVKFLEMIKRYLSLMLQNPEAIVLTAGNLMSSRFNPNLTPSYWGSHYWQVRLHGNQRRIKRICGFKRPCLSFAFERWKSFFALWDFFQKTSLLQNLIERFPPP